MKSFDVLKITGYRGLPVPNSMVRVGPNATRLAVVFPGLRYSADMPGCYYPAQVMLARGADVLNVDYEYTKSEFQTLSDEEQFRWIAEDASASLRAAMAARKYKKITLIGKSLGTIALAHLLAAEPALKDADFIWLTPVLREDNIRRAMMARRHHGLFVIGTADTQYEESPG